MKKIYSLFSLLILACLMLLGCDQQAFENLQVGVSTEAEVRQYMGEPALVWLDDNGNRVLEYPRGPEGLKTYMAEISADGRLLAMRQVLNAANVGKIEAGWTKDQVRRLIGKPNRTITYDLKPQEQHWEWRFQRDPSSIGFLDVVFNPAGVVVSSSVGDDPKNTTRY